jgi:hypothetical protein
MTRYRSIVYALLACGLLLCVLGGTPAAAETTILREANPPGPVRHGLDDVLEALSAKSIESGTVEITPLAESAVLEWEKPESYNIDVEGSHVTVSGSDAVGLMYGLFELAEQMTMTPGKGGAVLKALQDSSGAPAMEIRADNPFLTVETPSGESDAGSPISPWFYDEGFWRGYFDNLARNRFNLCDIHAMYSFETTGFPNLLPYFIESPTHREASWMELNPWRNQAMLRRIIDIAEDRGVHVALMNYSMDFPNIDVGDEKTQIEHTSWAVAEILRRLPKLWMFGFRIGESGKSEDFFERAFLQGIRDSELDRVRLYTRTWGATFKDLAQLGMAYPENFYIEIKYNGEHLGAPYNAIQGRWKDYSYQQYLNYPRYWKIIWQVRANGTHRLFPWFDADFARRAARANSFGGAVGMTLEPITAYFTQDPNKIFRNRDDADFLEFAYERYWAWYLAWGRTAYNPETPDAVFENAFKQRFGPKAGTQVHDLMTLSSKIIPLIYTHHCLGPDHRNVSPEFETGNCSTYQPWVTGINNIDTFANYGALDQQTSISPVVFADETLSRQLAGKKTPLEAADELDALADQCLDMIAKTTVASGQKEWDLLVNDVKAMASLARYYAAKDRAAVALQFYYKTGDVSQVFPAKEHMLEAAEQWRALDKVTAKQYRPILDRLRCGPDYTWDKQSPDIQADLARIDEVIAEIENAEIPKFGHVPVHRAAPGKDLVLRVGVAGIEELANKPVFLFYTLDESDPEPEYIECQPDGPWTFKAAIPAAQLSEGVRGGYRFAVPTGENLGVPVRGLTPSTRFVVTADTEKPVVAWKSVESDRKAGVVRIACTIDDPSGVASARLEWKPMPSEIGWQPLIDMKASGNTNVFTGEVPLTADGVLYSVVVSDTAGNVTRYPDITLETPYKAIDPWDPGLDADLAISSMGTVAQGLKGQAVNWPDVSGTGRPGTYYEYAGAQGQVDFTFNIERLSDNVLTLARVVHKDYSSADILVDGKKIGVLKGQQEGPGYLPAKESMLVRGLAAGKHTLSFALAEDGRFAFEGFKLVSQPNIIENFVISQGFKPFPGDKGKDMYPIGNPEVTWKTAEKDSRGVIALHAQVKPNEECYGYAATTLRCEKPVETDLLIGTNDGCYVWLNGELISERPGKRYFVHNGDRVPVKLKEGDNLLVMLVMQAGRYWLFNVNSESYELTSHLPDF